MQMHDTSYYLQTYLKELFGGITYDNKPIMVHSVPALDPSYPYISLQTNQISQTDQTLPRNSNELNEQLIRVNNRYPKQTYDSKAIPLINDQILAKIKDIPYNSHIPKGTTDDTFIIYLITFNSNAYGNDYKTFSYFWSTLKVAFSIQSYYGGI